MIQPTEKDIGRKVVYIRDYMTEAQFEKGVITSYNEQYVFVRYGSDNQAKSTRRQDLFWEEGDYEFYYWINLNRYVLAVAVVNRKYNDWAAYIGKVEGNNHNTEYWDVLRTGSKLDKSVANVLFPKLYAKYEWRA